jgi:hypothetical protein
VIHWLRRRFIAGFFVAVPVVASVLALIWIFRLVDGFTAPIYARLLGRDVPGLGLITTAVAVLLVGVVATNVIGRRLLQRVEHWLMLVPVFRTVYAPVKQLVLAFSPDNEYGFKQVVFIADAQGHASHRRRRAVPGVRLRPDQSPLPGRRPRRRAGARNLSRSERRGGGPHLPHGRHGLPRAPGGQRAESGAGRW